MPLPAGVTTFTLTGDELDATGAAGIPGTRGTLVPVDATGNPVRIVHLATGTEIVPAAVTFTIAADGTWTVGPLPYTDQAGLSVVGFQYKVTWNVPAWRASPGDKQFSVPGGTTSPVLYSSVTASPTVPTVLVPAVQSVSSVVGLTGVVTGTQIAADPAMKTAYDTRVALAGSPDLLISGAITRDVNGAATSAPVTWPDTSPGTYTADTVSSTFPGAVDAYHITYGSPVTKTYTQSAVTRDASTGAVTNRPAITVA